MSVLIVKIALSIILFILIFTKTHSSILLFLGFSTQSTNYMGHMPSNKKEKNRGGRNKKQRNEPQLRTASERKRLKTPPETPSKHLILSIHLHWCRPRYWHWRLRSGTGGSWCARTPHWGCVGWSVRSLGCASPACSHSSQSIGGRSPLVSV